MRLVWRLAKRLCRRGASEPSAGADTGVRVAGSKPPMPEAGAAAAAEEATLTWSWSRSWPWRGCESLSSVVTDWGIEYSWMLRSAELPARGLDGGGGGGETGDRWRERAAVPLVVAGDCEVDEDGDGGGGVDDGRGGRCWEDSICGFGCGGG